MSRRVAGELQIGRMVGEGVPFSFLFAFLFAPRDDPGRGRGRTGPSRAAPGRPRPPVVAARVVAGQAAGRDVRGPSREPSGRALMRALTFGLMDARFLW
jgi:hypothetical protein